MDSNFKKLNYYNEPKSPTKVSFHPNKLIKSDSTDSSGQEFHEENLNNNNIEENVTKVFLFIFLKNLKK